MSKEIKNNSDITEEFEEIRIEEDEENLLEIIDNSFNNDDL